MKNWICVALFVGIALTMQAQSTPPPTGLDAPRSKSVEDEDSDRGVNARSLPKDILQDQEALFTMPIHMRERQWKMMLPLGALAVGLVATDTASEAHVTSSSSTASHFKTLSDAGLATMVGVGGSMYLWGHFAQNEHMRESGFLSGEAALDAYLDSALISLVAGRDRPLTANRRGNFFDGGSSFPSQHAAVSWAIASVIAHEYPGTLTQILSYGLAGAVSAARVEAHQHFVSDAVIGSAIGWYLGRQVFRARSSSADIDQHNWGTFERDENSEAERATSEMGSNYVPLDSWVYEAIDRLAAMGYVQTNSASVRSWTKLECARLLAEASNNGAEEDPVAAPLMTALNAELTHEARLWDGGKNSSARLEAIYGRFTGISGTPLRDSYHFAQTLVDDDGRPYGQGPSGIVGVSGGAEAGPLAFYLRGEYQYASANPPYNVVAQQTIAASDGLPYGWNLLSGTTSRFRTVEAYASLNMSNWQLSFGQQSLWFGPDRSTSLMLSNNAQAMPMLRLSRVSPLRLPSFLEWMGPVHADIFFAREGGVHYVAIGPPYVVYGNASQALNPPPYVWGINLSVKPTANFEFGLAHTAIFAGYSRPLNLKTFLHTFSDLGNDQAIDPGKRTEEFVFSYRIPGLRNWLSAYTEAFSYDNLFEGKFKSRYALDPGIYLPQLPGLRKMQLRLEGVYTNLPELTSPAYFYSNSHYAQGYTNYGQIFGSWVGRQGSGATASGTYWFSGRNKATVSYRRMIADKSFLQGGQLEDFSGSITWMLHPGVEFTAMSQYESWDFPLLANGARSDVTTSFGLRFFPAAR